MKNGILKSSLATLTLVATTLTGAPAARASAVESSTVVDLTIEGTQSARVALSTPVESKGRPTCHVAAYFSHYAFDISTAKGKALFSALQAAQLSGKKVSIVGQFACTDLGNGVVIETLGTLTLWT